MNNVISPSYLTSSVFKLGPSCLAVPMSLFSDNRQRLCKRLREGGEVPEGSIVVLQGGGQESRYCSDTEIVFRQVCILLCVCEFYKLYIQ